MFCNLILVESQWGKKYFLNYVLCGFWFCFDLYESDFEKGFQDLDSWLKEKFESCPAAQIQVVFVKK